MRTCRLLRDDGLRAGGAHGIRGLLGGGLPLGRPDAGPADGVLDALDRLLGPAGDLLGLLGELLLGHLRGVL
ncbi:hypothetical protein ACTNFJ_12440, partial (plasmid) [Leucobacter sp. W1153]|uniref:hypothetical protein n=1 Tax=Leucobacter sp. W1153 TaxID=3439064 RepID=UPI00403559DB